MEVDVTAGCRTVVTGSFVIYIRWADRVGVWKACVNEDSSSRVMSCRVKGNQRRREERYAGRSIIRIS